MHSPLDEAKLSAPSVSKKLVEGSGIDVKMMEKQMLQRETKAAILCIEIFKVRENENV